MAHGKFKSTEVLNQACYYLFENIVVEGAKKCWVWSGTKSRKGCGVVQWRGRSYLAHEFSYNIFVGRFYPTVTLNHTCGVPACCNPAHLVETRRVQTRRLRATTVRRIREEFCHSSPSVKYLARTHRVAEITIRRLLRGYSWKKAGGPLR